ncbi:MAG: exported protein of unknown function, partial [Candidatus Saccharibacteria bacterium]|nr:exported protein of unknown function [Candidatus Saccharibacteria bacterium]
DGNLPGCFNYAGYVTFKVKVSTPQTANFNVTKTVSKHGANNWQKSYNAQPGETVDYLIEYKNTDSAQQDNVVVKDSLPAGETLVSGSTKVNTEAHPEGEQVNDDITSKGINVGSYATGGGTWVEYSATVAANDQLPACGNNTLINTAHVETDFGYKEDTANVIVNKVCQPGETPPTVLPTTGTDSTVVTLVGVGMTTAGAAYAATSKRVRNLFRA